MRKLSLIAALALGSAGGAQAMSYGLTAIDDGRCTRRCSPAIVASGIIKANEAEQFLMFVHSVDLSGGVPRTLMVSSPGGDLAGALALGLTLRRLGLRTMVSAVAPSPGDGRAAVLTPGICGSACVFVLMAGVNRHVVPGSRVAVHAPQVNLVTQGRRFVLGGPLAQAVIQGVAPVMQSYTRRMGVDPALIALASRVPPETRLTLTPSELSRYRLITGGAAGRPARRIGARSPGLAGR